MIKSSRTVLALSLILSLCLLFSGCRAKDCAALRGSMEIVYTDLSGISSEGGSIKGVYSNGELIMMSVSVYGEMGNQLKEYAFFSDCTKISILAEFYIEPFYLTPDKVSIDHTERTQYLLVDEAMYNFDSDNEGVFLLSETERGEAMKEMDNYISILSQSRKQ